MMSEVDRRPSTEVRPPTKRRRFTAQYKQRILREAATFLERGELGALLRREGLYSSHLSKWKQQAAAGALSGLTPKKRGRPPVPTDPRDGRMAALERANTTLTRRDERAEALVAVRKNFRSCWGSRCRRGTTNNGHRASFGAHAGGDGDLRGLCRGAVDVLSHPPTGPGAAPPPARPRSLDQQAVTSIHRTKHGSLNSASDCLKALDIFRRLSRRVLRSIEKASTPSMPIAASVSLPTTS